MDILAHGLWSYALFSFIGQPWLAVLFGILPDLLSFGILFVSRLFTGTLHVGKPAASEIPSWVYTSYDWTHSLVIAAVVLGIVFFVMKDSPIKPWFLLAWPMHIVIDIFSHDMSFFPTPFLWPLSDYRFVGIPWSNPWFMGINYGLLVIVYAYLYLL